MARHVRAGDMVIVTAGSEKGKTGEVSSVNPKAETVIVKGVNLRTKHIRPTQRSPQGAVVQVEAPIHISNVSPVVDGKPTRVRFEKRSDGSKVRVAVRSGQPIATIARKRKGDKSKTETI